MPIGPFDPIPKTRPPQTLTLEHINELRRALTGVQDAYDVALANGFVGTQADWLASLKGKSAYQIAVALGFSGDEAAWVASLKGEKGDPGSGTTEAENALGAAGGGLLADGQVTATTYAADGTLIPAANDLLVEGLERDGITLGAVDSVNGQTGAVLLDSDAVGAVPARSTDAVFQTATGLVPAHQAPLDAGALVMATFRAYAMEGHLLISTDGGNTFAAIPGATNWADPSVDRGVRDPTVTRFGGHYLMAHTRALKTDILGSSNTWGLASSEDLLTWQQVAVITPSVPVGMTQLWAPDLVADGDRLYCFFAASTDNRGTFHIYIQSATASDLTAWSTPVLVGGLSNEVIDPNVVHVGGSWILTYTSGSRVYTGIAAAPEGPYTDLDQVPTPVGLAVEGGYFVHTPGGRLRLYYDAFLTNGIWYMESDDLVGWGPPTAISTSLGDPRHASFLWLSHAELAGLRAMWRLAALP